MSDPRTSNSAEADGRLLYSQFIGQDGSSGEGQGPVARAPITSFYAETMPPISTVFYAYWFNEEIDDFFRPFILIFSNRKTADEWWRGVHLMNKSTMQRISPYVYRSKGLFIEDVTKDWISPFSNSGVGNSVFAVGSQTLKEFLVIPTPPLVDHLSGGWFSIRYRSDAPGSGLYWNCAYFGNEACITLGTPESRTMFKIVAPNLEEGTVMIATDDIVIIAEGQGFLRIAAGSINGFATTAIEADATRFKFRDLADGKFRLGASGVFVKYDQPPGEIFQRSGGWELAA